MSFGVSQFHGFNAFLEEAVAGAVVAITQTANPAGVAGSGGTTTYSSQSIGSEAADRVVVICIGGEIASSIDSCTIDFGSGDTAMTAVATEAVQGSVRTRMFYLAVPTGTTATFKIAWPGNPGTTANHVAIYSITGSTGTPTGGTDASTDMDATDPLTTGSTTIPSNGGMLAVAAGASDADAKTWADLNEDIDADAGTFRFTTATSTTAGTATRTCTGGVNGEDGALTYSIWSPA